MTKKELRWRFKELPTVQEVTELMANKIITPEEARDLLFNETTGLPKTDEVEALKRQIEFLEGLVKELSKNRNQLGTIIQQYPVYVEKWIERRTPQYLPNVVYCSSNLTGSSDSHTNMSLTSYSQKLLS